MIKRNLLMLAGVVVLAAVPLALYRPEEGGEGFVGTDDQAKQLIERIDPEYKPWYSNFWEPPNSEVASMLFALQAAIGAGLVFYCIGYYRGRHMERTEKGADASR